jgi:hypothetical protein
MSESKFEKALRHLGQDVYELWLEHKKELVPILIKLIATRCLALKHSDPHRMTLERAVRHQETYGTMPPDEEKT